MEDPRLVRLWPFAPGRTRGNAALAACIRTRDVRGVQAILDDWFTRRYGCLEPTGVEHGAQPVLIATLRQFPESFYWDAVRDQVHLKDRRNAMQGHLHRVWATARGRRGIIGASAAIAWTGGHDHTWECIAWRQGTGTRNVPEALVHRMSVAHPSTFMNRDPNRVLIAPRTPCPVLYGIRGETADAVLDAHAFLQSEDCERSLDHRAFRTNQATGDHLLESRSGVVESTETLRGGHVRVRAGENLLAFAAGGPVNALAQSLEIGDRIEWLGLASPEGSIHLERLRLVSGVRNRKRPLCACGRRYKSKGRGQSLRCPGCGQAHPDAWQQDSIRGDWVEPLPSQMRHLARPLTRSGNLMCMVDESAPHGDH